MFVIDGVMYKDIRLSLFTDTADLALADPVSHSYAHIDGWSGGGGGWRVDGGGVDGGGWMGGWVGEGWVGDGGWVEGWVVDGGWVEGGWVDG